MKTNYERISNNKKKENSKMKTNRTLFAYLIAPALVMIAIAFTTSAYAQGEQRFKIGDTVEVANGAEWSKATVTEVGVNKDAYKGQFYKYRVHVHGQNTISDTKWWTDYVDGTSTIRPAKD
jgi:hypothetical protein